MLNQDFGDAAVPGVKAFDNSRLDCPLPLELLNELFVGAIFFKCYFAFLPDRRKRSKLRKLVRVLIGEGMNALVVHDNDYTGENTLAKDTGKSARTGVGRLGDESDCRLTQTGQITDPRGNCSLPTLIDTNSIACNRHSKLGTGHFHP